METNNTTVIDDEKTVFDDYVDPNMEADLADILNDAPIPEQVVDEPAQVEDVEVVPEEAVVEAVPEVVPVTTVVEPVTEIPSVELSEVEELRATVARLTEALDKTAGPKSTVAEPTSVADPVQVKSVPTQSEATVLNLLDMYKDTDLTDVMDSKEGFLKFMGDILNAHAALTRTTIMRELPQVISPVVSSYNSQRDIANDFYGRYPHLSKIKNYVSNVAVDVQARNQDKTLAEILELTALEVNSVIGFKGTTPVESTVPVVKKPVLPGATGGVRSKPAPSNTLADEISDLIND